MGLKIGEFIDKDIQSVSKLVEVLKYLNTGRDLEVGGFTYKLGETSNGGFSLLFKMVVTSHDKIEREEWFGYQGGFSIFSAECNELTDEDITIMQANLVLSQINKR